MKRQVFFSFEYNKDNWRAAQVRRMGQVENNSTFSDNSWEKVKRGTDLSIKRWIDKEMMMRSCVVVLIGSTTANRKWINYEIKKAYELNKGMVGVYINRLEGADGTQSSEGSNPFQFILADNGNWLSKYVNCFKSSFESSKYVYQDIEENLEDLIEYAVNNKVPHSFI